MSGWGAAEQHERERERAKESAICVERLDVETRVVGNIDRLAVRGDALRVGELAIAGAEAPPHLDEVAVLVELLHPVIAVVDHVEASVGREGDGTDRVGPRVIGRQFELAGALARSAPRFKEFATRAENPIPIVERGGDPDVARQRVDSWPVRVGLDGAGGALLPEQGERSEGRWRRARDGS